MATTHLKFVALLAAADDALPGSDAALLAASLNPLGGGRRHRRPGPLISFTRAHPKIELALLLSIPDLDAAGPEPDTDVRVGPDRRRGMAFRAGLSKFAAGDAPAPLASRP